jgi:hypothetical protein
VSGLFLRYFFTFGKNKKSNSMIRKFFLAAALLFALNANAQSTQRCAEFNNNAQARIENSAYEAQLREWITAHPQNSVQATLVIPVVVHVVYNIAFQNISDAQVMSQIVVLNEDFGRTNADTVKTPAGFAPVAANTGIQFCLAQIDTLGNATTGIEHIATTVTSFISNGNVKHASTGGANAWDVTKYFNIWVCNLGPGPLGIAEFPTPVVSHTYGVVISFSVFGSNYTSFGMFPSLNAPYDRGRVTTHEIGHCFNLLHTSPGSTSCTDNDNVSDTPVPYSFSNNPCPTYPVLDACNPTAPGVQFMNFMDGVTEDTCINMFTAGQAVRMNAVLSVPPYYTLPTSGMCGPNAINSFDIGINFSITPNPSAGKFMLQFNKISPCSISVYNEMGSVVKEYAWNEMSGNEMEIDLTGNADGVYFIRVVTEEGVSNRKIIISR